MESARPKTPYRDELSSSDDNPESPPPGYSVPPPGFNAYSMMNQPGPAPGLIPTVVQPVVIISGGYGPVPVGTNCPNCRVDIESEITKSPSTSAWLAFLLMCIFGLWFGCCCIPFCMDSCKKVTHRCPNCHNIIGVYQP